MSEKATYIIDLRDAFSPKLAQASNNLDKFEHKMTGISGKSGSGGLFGEFSASFARAMAPLAIATGVVMFTGKLITMGAELEKTRVQIEVLVGEAERANQLFQDMTQMAIKTPFGMSDVVDAGKLLLSFGADVNDVMPTLSMLGDVAQGDANKMHLITLAFAQMSSTGRLMGQDLLQMINAGFNPLGIIAKELGMKDLKVLKKAMEDGAISAAMVKEAFIIATSEGGRFSGMMERIAETVSGQWAAFTGEIEHAFASLGTKTGPMVVGIIKALREGFDMLIRVDWSPFITTFEEIGALSSEYLGLLGEVWEALGFTTDGMTALQSVMNYFAISLRVVLTPLRLLLEGMKLLIMLGQTLTDVFKGVGMVLYGVFTQNFAMIKMGIDETVRASKEGFTDLFEEVKKFGQRESEGWQKAISGGTAKEKKEGTDLQRFSRTAGVFDSLKNLGSASVGGQGKVGRADGEVRSGGVKNIVINITKLVGEVKFEKLDNMSEMKVVEIVKRALLTAVNDANVAVN